jgi:hypothetical protein
VFDTTRNAVAQDNSDGFSVASESFCDMAIPLIVAHQWWAFVREDFRSSLVQLDAPSGNAAAIDAPSGNVDTMGLLGDRAGRDLLNMETVDTEHALDLDDSAGAKVGTHTSLAEKDDTTQKGKVARTQATSPATSPPSGVQVIDGGKGKYPASTCVATESSKTDIQGRSIVAQFSETGGKCRRFVCIKDAAGCIAGKQPSIV